MSILCVVVATCTCAAAVAETPRPGKTTRRGAPTGWVDGSGLLAGQIDPLRFFDELVGRYRRLTVYRDSVRVVRITDRYGQEPRRQETQLNCEILEGELHVKTPGSQILETLGLDLPLRTGEATKDAMRRRDLQLAPHLALKFSDEPLDGMHTTGTESLTPIDAAPVRVDDRTMVQLQLRTGDGLSEDCEAKFDLLIDPDSMLIERITGEERLPDGATRQTTMDITPVQIDGEVGPPASAEEVAEEAAAGPEAGPDAGPDDASAPPPLPPRGPAGGLQSVG
ncbi:MAG: hypothetical protein ACYTGG_13480 [Planctomycetota bacterium]|jgi:hypothetical protein